MLLFVPCFIFLQNLLDVKDASDMDDDNESAEDDSEGMEIWKHMF